MPLSAAIAITKRRNALHHFQDRGSGRLCRILIAEERLCARRSLQQHRTNEEAILGKCTNWEAEERRRDPTFGGGHGM